MRGLIELSGRLFTTKENCRRPAFYGVPRFWDTYTGVAHYSGW